MSNPILEQLRDDVERGDAWTPHSDPSQPNPLVGEALGWSEGKTKDGTRGCAVLEVLADGKVWSLWTWHAALRAQLTGSKDSLVPVEERPVQMGTFVAVRYLGKFPRQDGDGETHRYRTALSKADAATAEVGQGGGEAPTSTDADDGIPF